MDVFYVTTKKPPPEECPKPGYCVPIYITTEELERLRRGEIEGVKNLDDLLDKKIANARWTLREAVKMSGKA